MKMIVDGLPPKTKCHFSKTESEVYTSMCYMDIGKTATAVELMHSKDYALWTEVSSCQLTPDVSKESTDEINTNGKKMKSYQGRKC